MRAVYAELILVFLVGVWALVFASRPPALVETTVPKRCSHFRQRVGLGIACVDGDAKVSDGDAAISDDNATLDPLRQQALEVRIDINHASESELEGLPGIGPALARRIIAARPYTDPHELERVRGIGKKTLVRLLARVRTSAEGQ